MKKIILLLMLGSCGMLAHAQQDPLYTQYMFNGLVLNPAYAGSKGYVSSTLLARQQWSGIDGAPATQSFSINGPSRNLHHGFGLTAVNDRAGAVNTFGVAVDYAYRILTGKNSALALGLEGGIGNYRTNLLDQRSQTANDPTIAANNLNVWKPDAATGIYFNSQHFFAGISARHLIPTRLYDHSLGNHDAQRELHYNFTTGIVLNLCRDIKLKPSVFVNYHPAAPLQVDGNLSFLFVEKLWVGATYRSNGTMAALVQFQPTRAFRIGYAYDYSRSALQRYTNGSHELMLGFDLHFKSHNNVSPRYF
jgi:type IX secretion system PorP/SprF family membrane protein